MIDFQDPPKNVFMGTANIARDEADELRAENEALKQRIQAISKVLADYALKITELEVKLAEYGNLHD